MVNPPWLKKAALPAGAAFGVNSVRIPLAPVDKRPLAAFAHRTTAPGRKSLTAASKVLERPTTREANNSNSLDWQREAWGFYKITGELRYAANLYGNGMSRIQMCLSRRQDNGPTLRLSEQKRLTPADKLAVQLWEDITAEQSDEEMRRLAGILLFVAGEGILVGLPAKPKDRRRSGKGRKLVDYTWQVFSRDDVRRDNGQVFVQGNVYDESDVILTKFWRPDPQYSRWPDSPTQSVLPILRELNGLTMYVSSIIDSRLAGAGVLILPNSATVLGATAPEDDQEEDPTVAAIIEAMVTPIKDRSSAAAVVPLILTVPDEAADAIRHITFSSPLDLTAKELRDELIRRLAIGFDMPAEQLLGMALSASSHWGSWTIAEDTVRLHFMPGVQILATALLTELLIPMLIDAGVDEDVAHSYFFELDGEDLISRPNVASEAVELYKLGLLKGTTAVTAAGFELSDMPEEDNNEDRALQLALKICQTTPQLFQEPGLPAIVSQIRSALSGEDASNAPADALPPPPAPTVSEGRPETPATGPGERGAGPKTSNNPGPPTRGKQVGG